MEKIANRLYSLKLLSGGKSVKSTSNSNIVLIPSANLTCTLKGNNFQYHRPDRLADLPRSTATPLRFISNDDQLPRQMQCMVEGVPNVHVGRVEAGHRIFDHLVIVCFSIWARGNPVSPAGWCAKRASSAGSEKAPPAVTISVDGT